MKLFCAPSNFQYPIPNSQSLVLTAPSKGCIKIVFITIAFSSQHQPGNSTALNLETCPPRQENAALNQFDKGGDLIENRPSVLQIRKMSYQRRLALLHTANAQEIRDGRVADVYFERTEKILKAKGVDKVVTAAFTTKNHPQIICYQSAKEA